MSIDSIYIIGSLRNPEILSADKALSDCGLEVFSDWYAAGEFADDSLRDYYRGKGLSYSDALNSYAAKHIFEFDKHHLDRCDAALMVYPAGRSAHLELGYVVGKGKPAYVLMDGEPERYDIMLQFATKIFMSKEEMIEYFTMARQEDTRSSSPTKPSGFVPDWFWLDGKWNPYKF